MIIKPFQKSYKQQCVDVFDSNSGRYFDASERAEFVSYLESPNSKSTYFVGFDSDTDRVIACGGIAVNGTVGSLCWGMVYNSFHSFGLGKSLTKFRLNRLKDCPELEVVKIETSQHTAGFYEKLGFVTTGIVKDGFGPGIDCVSMSFNAFKY